MAASKEKLYIFQREDVFIKSLILSNTEQEASGNLFGLWTTDGEPVIHIVSIEHSCEVEKDPSLSHIGYWYYGDSSKYFSSGRSEKDVANCSHRTEGRFLQMKIIIDRSGQEVTLEPYIVNSQRGRPRGLDVEVLKTENLFRTINTRSRLEGSFKREEEMEWSPSGDYPGSTYPQKGPDGENYHASGAVQRHLEEERLRSNDEYLSGTRRRSRLFPSGYQRYTSNDFKVFMFKEDIERMEKYIRAYPHQETGGDLFGLWTSSGDAVIHVVLGPGKNCKRTGTSFYQDIPYLHRNGNLLTQDYLLCHIGEWHSHHQLQLFQPSQGDSTTVIRHYPRGTHGFLLIIGNIERSGSVMLSPYLYTERSIYSFDRKGTLEHLRIESPFSKIEKIKKSMKEGRQESEVRENSRCPELPYPRPSSNIPRGRRSRGQTSRRGASKPKALYV